MTRRVITVSEDESVQEVLELMLRHRVHCVPVVRNGVPVGMVARRDLLKLMTGLVGKQS